MFLQRLKFFFSAVTLRAFLRYFFFAIGAQWLVVEVLNHFLKNKPWFQQINDNLLLPFLGVALLYALFLSFPPLRYGRRLRGPNAEIVITVGDLFTFPSNIAIGCSDCFDTKAPDAVDPKSLIAQLVSRVDGVLAGTLDQLIAQSLASHSIAGTVDPGFTRGKNARFPVGTVAVVKEGPRKVFLTVFSKANYDKTTHTTQEDLWLSLSALWKVVRRDGGLEPIAVPVWGSGLAYFNAARISLIQIVLLSFVIATRERPVSRKLTLVIHEKDYDPEEMAEAIQLVNTLDF